MRNLRRAAVVVTAMCLCLSAKAQTQQPSLWLAGVEMRLGMTQDEVMRRIPSQFVVELLPGSSGSYGIRSRERNSNGLYEFYGSIGFYNGKLTAANKDWYVNSERSDYSLADAIYFVMADVEKRGEALLAMKTTSQRQVEFTSDEVILFFTKRRVTISATEYKGSKSVQVSEEISSRQ